MDPTPAAVHLIPVRKEAPAIARRAVQQDVPPTVPADKVEDVKVVISELVQNVVLHSSLDEGSEFRVRISTRPRTVRIVVEDTGTGFSKDDIFPASVGPWSHRGLRIVDVIASRWGAERTARGGTLAWAEIDT